MIPPTTTGASTPRSRSASMTLGISSRCEPDRIERPTTWTPSCSALAAICDGRQADALVDDVHADVARAHGDLLGAVGVAVEAGLADEDLQPAPERLADALDLLAQLGSSSVVAGAGGGLADAGRRAVLAEGVAQRRRPLAGRHARAGGRDRRAA